MKDILRLFFGCWLPFVQLSVEMIPQCSNYVEDLFLCRLSYLSLPFLKKSLLDRQTISDEASVSNKWINWGTRGILWALSSLCWIYFRFLKNLFCPPLVHFLIHIIYHAKKRQHWWLIAVWESPCWRKNTTFSLLNCVMWLFIYFVYLFLFK